MDSAPLVSVIIPTRNSAATLRACLQSLHRQSYQELELIVVDRNSTDGTKTIAKEFTNRVFNHGPERAAQRNFGAEHSHGRFLLFIDSDMELSRDVVAECVALAQASPQLAAINIPEASFGTGFWAKCKALERSYYVGVDWIEAPRFVAAETFRESGRWNENLQGAEDFDLAQRLRRFGLFGHIQAFIRHNEGRIKLSRLLRKRVYYYGEGFSREGQSNQFTNLPRFIALFFSRPWTILRHPIVWLGMMFMRAAELFARLLGLALSKQAGKR